MYKLTNHIGQKKKIKNTLLSYVAIYKSYGKMQNFLWGLFILVIQFYILSR